MSEEGGYLSVIEPQGQPVYSQFVSVAVDLHQILDVNARLDVAWFLLDTYGCQGDKENDAWITTLITIHICKDTKNRKTSKYVHVNM